MEKRIFVKSSLYFFVYLFLVCFFVSDVVAIGLAPDYTYMDFEPFGAGQIRMIVINTEDKDVTVRLSLSGKFSKYFEVEEESVLIKKGGSKSLLINYNFPYDVGSPGKNGIDVKVIEKSGEGGAISAHLSVVAKIVVDVPYPGRYVDYSVSGGKVNLGEFVNYVFEIDNRGLENLFSVKPYVFVYKFGDEGEMIEVLNKIGDVSSLAVGKNKQIVVSFNSTNVGVGTYFVDTYVIYDAVESFHRNMSLNVGEERMEVVSFSRELDAGGIRKFFVELENKWNSVMEDVYVEVFLREEGVIVTTSTLSQSESFKPWEKRMIPVYVDVSGLESGNYQAVIKINYGDKISEEIVDVEIRDVFEVGTGMIVAFVIALLVIADILWMIFLSRRGVNGEGMNKGDEVGDKLNKLEKKV